MKKLKISELQVKSFVTAVQDKEIKTVKGGSKYVCSQLGIHESLCAKICLAPPTVAAYSDCCN